MYRDSSTGHLYLRIAYAGPPLSGKTETLKSLIPNLYGRPASDLLYSPLAARGRTLYFDWAEWEGGLFRSGRLHCQITAVPGQESLQPRRRLLVEDADAVVFVVDSGPEKLAANRRALAELQPWLERDGLPPVSVIYQCNKRDLPTPLGLDAIRSGLGLGADADLHESSATQGDGVRMCFVAAVGACVRRAEVLIGLSKLPAGTPPVNTGEQLLERLRLAEEASGLKIEDVIIEPLPAVEPAPVATRPEVPVAAVTGPSLAAAPSAVASPAATTAARPGPRPAGQRPAVLPMSDWLALQASAAATLAAATLEVASAPAAVAARPAPLAFAADPSARAAAPAPPKRRLRVMPMADWLASQSASAQAAAAAPSAPLSSPGTQVAAEAASGVAAAGARVSPSLLAASSKPAARPAVMPMDKVVPRPVAATQGPVSAAPPALALAPARPATPTPAAARPALVPPAPWLPGWEATLVEAWPEEGWTAALRTLDPNAAPPAQTAGGFQGALGAGRFARSWQIHTSGEDARIEFQRLVDWLVQLDNGASSSRSVLLSGSDLRGFCAWQVVQRVPTLDLLVVRAFGKEVSSKDSAHFLTFAAHAFLAACDDFAHREARLPLHLYTLARQDRRTVYADFLPREPSGPPGTPMARLEAELHSLVNSDRLAALNVTEVLRELESLATAKPQLAESVELLQSLLIGH